MNNAVLGGALNDTHTLRISMAISDRIFYENNGIAKHRNSKAVRLEERKSNGC